MSGEKTTNRPSRRRDKLRSFFTSSAAKRSHNANDVFLAASQPQNKAQSSVAKARENPAASLDANQPPTVSVRRSARPSTFLDAERPVLSFKYTPLPVDGASIRLLRLHPSSAHDATIRCTILDASLAQAAQYEALSYTWGDTHQNADIELDEHNVQATANLCAALRALRKKDKPRTLWVDALCIDQTDPHEQGRQVKMMWDIYANAERVLVWLGDDQRESALAMANMAKQTAQEKFKLRKTKREKPADFEEEWCGCEAGRWDVEPPRVGIQDVLQREWFTRVWVLQEVAAAKDVLVICGSQVVSGKDFYNEIAVVAQVYKTFSKMIVTTRPVIDLMNPSITTLGKRSTPLLELIETFRPWNATRAIDKVYALLNFSSDAYNEPMLQPDYTITKKTLGTKLLKFGFPNSAIEPHTGVQSNTIDFEIEGFILGTINGRWAGKHVMVSWTFQTKSHSDQPQPQVTFNPQVLEIFEGQWQIDLLGERQLEYGDFVCLLRGALRPTILRHRYGHFDVIMIATPCPTPYSNEFRTDQGRWEVHASRETVWAEKRPAVPILNMAWSDVIYALSNESEGTTKFKLSWDPFRPLTSAEVKGYTPTPNDMDVQWEARTELMKHMAMEKRGAGEREETWTCKTLMGVHTTILKDLDKLKNGTSDWTITLHTAAGGGFVDSMRLLLDAGAGIDSANEKGYTALHCAANNGHTETVEALLKNRATQKPSSDDLETPLHFAVRRGHDAICQLLLEYGADPNPKEGKIRTPLFEAVFLDRFSIVDMLLKAGADPNIMQKLSERETTTPLHMAAWNGQASIVKLLLAAGAKCDVPSRMLYLPIHHTASKGDTESLLLLLNAGSPVNPLNGGGVTPLDYAVFRGHEQAAKELRDRHGRHNLIDPSKLTR